MSQGFLKVATSFVHQGKEKITSLTVCIPSDKESDSIQLTFSDKQDPMIRIKLNMEEVAGLAVAIRNDKVWNAFHTYEKGTEKTETKISFSSGFINAERAGKKIALKLTSNEQACLTMTLERLFQHLVDARIR